jgi:hypothetical protein
VNLNKSLVTLIKNISLSVAINLRHVRGKLWMLLRSADHVIVMLIRMV